MNDFTVFMDELPLWSAPFGLALLDMLCFRKRLSGKELESVLHASGFSVRQVIEDRFSMRFADGTTLFRHYLIRNFFLDGWKSLVPPDRQEKIFGRIEARLNRTAREKGHVSLTIPYMVLDGVPVF